MRRQFTHAIDVLPTILDLIGLEAPAEIDGVEQSPIEGTSFATLARRRRRARAARTQYFEMLGSRGIYHDGLEGRHVQAARPCTTTGSTPTRRSRTTSGSCST